MSANDPRDELGNLLPMPDTDTFAAWDDPEIVRRLIARTVIAPGIIVSTLCLGPDHLGLAEMVDGEPRLYETIIVGGPHDGQLWPLATRGEAERDHNEAVLIARHA